MWLFYEVKAARLDWNGLEFIDKELIINFPGQVMRITDVVARVPVKNAVEPALQTTVDELIIPRGKQGESDESADDTEDEPEQKAEFIIVHIDAEANKPKPIPNRMFEYYGLLRIIEDIPVLPIALIIRGRTFNANVQPEIDTDSSKMRTYREKLWGEKLLEFRYYEIVLQDLLSEEYLDLNDPVAAALAVLMKHPKELSALIKKRSLDIITKNDDVSEGDKHFLEGFVHEYVPNAAIQGGTEEIMQQLEEYQLTYRERLERELQLTIRERLDRELQRTIRVDAIIKILTTKFKEVANDILDIIKSIEDTNLLEELLLQAALIQSLDELALPEPV
ncbi:MAG: hypothetical protein AAF639_16195 [Chloroflexota bacterium]